MMKKTYILLSLVLLLISVKPAHAACTSPTGTAGQQVYNTSYSTMQFCNGTSWIAMGALANETWTKSGSNLYYSDGNVGIGNSAPGYKLDVTGTARITGATTLSSTLGVTGATTLSSFTTAGIVTNTAAGLLQTNASLPINLGGTNNSTAYTSGSVIFSNGTSLTQDNAGLYFDATNNRLGINKTSPNYTLDVAGTLNVTGSGTLRYAGGPDIEFAFPERGDGGRAFVADSSDSLTINYAGDFAGGVNIGGSTSTPVTHIGNLGTYTYFNSGRVGINTASPNYELQVDGNIYANGGWLRASGQAGVYFESYGGGWYMNDTNWIRAYNDKGIFTNAIVYGGSDVRAPIFYDIDNMGYYLNPNGNSVLSSIYMNGYEVINSASPTIYLQDTDSRSAMIHVNSNIFYILRGDGTNSTIWGTVNGYWPLEINLENNAATFGGAVHSAGRITDVTGYVAPVGTITMFGGSSAPAGWLLCDGGSYSTTGTYADLYAVIGTTYGGSGGTFNVPDMRNAVARGAGTSTRFTQNGTTTLGTYQDDAFQRHKHLANINTRSNVGTGIGGSYTASTYDGIQHGAMDSNTYPSLTTGADQPDGTNGTPRTTNETRMKNVGVNFIIKY